MIIVSQDKSVIVNFNNVESIDIVADLDGTGETPYKIYYETASKREKLGEYATEERAKEVLQEIIDNIHPKSNVDMDIDGISFGVQSPIYYMPKE